MASPSKSTPKVLPTLMPCKIEPCETSITPQFWSPKISREGEGGESGVTAYFRGRRLMGKDIELPDGYVGFITSSKTTEQGEHTSQQQSNAADHSESEELSRKQFPKLEQKYHFTKMRVLGHEEQPAGDIPQLKAMQEWAGMAAAIHKA